MHVTACRLGLLTILLTKKPIHHEESLYSPFLPNNSANRQRTV
jgi:hypothetical protein